MKDGARTVDPRRMEITIPNRQQQQGQQQQQQQQRSNREMIPPTSNTNHHRTNNNDNKVVSSPKNSVTATPKRKPHHSNKSLPPPLTKPIMTKDPLEMQIICKPRSHRGKKKSRRSTHPSKPPSSSSTEFNWYRPSTFVDAKPKNINNNNNEKARAPHGAGGPLGPKIHAYYNSSFLPIEETNPFVNMTNNLLLSEKSYNRRNGVGTQPSTATKWRRNSCPKLREFAERHYDYYGKYLLCRKTTYTKILLLASFLIGFLTMVNLASRGLANSYAQRDPRDAAVILLEEEERQKHIMQRQEKKIRYNKMRSTNGGMIHPVPKRNNQLMYNGLRQPNINAMNNNMNNNNNNMQRPQQQQGHNLNFVMTNPNNDGGNEYITEQGAIIQSQSIPDVISYIPPPPPPLAEEVVAVPEAVEAPPIVVFEAGPAIVEPPPIDPNINPPQQMMESPIDPNMDPQQQIEPPIDPNMDPQQQMEPLIDPNIDPQQQQMEPPIDPNIDPQQQMVEPLIDPNIQPLQQQMMEPAIDPNMVPPQLMIDHPLDNPQVVEEIPPTESIPSKEGRKDGKKKMYDIFGDIMEGMNGMFDQAPIEAFEPEEEDESFSDGGTTQETVPNATKRTKTKTKTKKSHGNSAAEVGLVGLPKVERDGEVRLSELSNFKDISEPWDASDVPIFLHIPKAGGSTIKDIIGTCHRFVMASEKGVLDGHGDDADISIVYPGGGPVGQDRSPFVNVDTTTLNGIVRAKDMDFADSGLADIVVTPFIFEVNDLMTPTAKGRLFTVFRHPIERAISMFYYIQIATWEVTYNPEVEFWTIEQYANSGLVENNWLTRQLSNQPAGDLTDKNLLIAKNVIRRKFMVGLVSNIEATMDRLEKFFRWTYHVNPPNQEICRQALIDRGANSNAQSTKPKPEPGSDEWKMLEWQNKYDLELYAYIEVLFDEQEQFVSNLPDEFRNIDATCCKCGPATYPPEGFDCPVSILN